MVKGNHKGDNMGVNIRQLLPIEQSQMLSDMWEEYKTSLFKHWESTETIEEKYQRIGKKYGFKSIELWRNDDGEICGIKVDGKLISSVDMEA